MTAQIRIAKKGGNLVVSLTGAMSDDLQERLAPLPAKLKNAHVIFDCAGVATINSLGFRAWQGFLKGLEKDTTFEFSNCPPDFIEYCNLLPTTSFARCVSSLAVPFSCETCQSRTLPVFDAADLAPDRAFDLIICPKCNGAMTATVAPGQYLEFMQAAKD